MMAVNVFCPALVSHLTKSVFNYLSMLAVLEIYDVPAVNHLGKMFHALAVVFVIIN